MIKIAPSILAANPLDMKNEVINADIAGADYIHIDVMDGHYVPNISFGPDLIKNIKQITNKILDVHLMIKPVLPFIEKFVGSGADIISFHPETEKEPKKVIKLIKNSGCKAGIAIHPNTKIDQFTDLIEIIDLVIIMTVIPGFGGQKFLYDQTYKIKELKEMRKLKSLNFEIEVDGGINKETGKICVDNGADILVAGSYIYGSNKLNYKKLINSLR